MTAEDFYQQMIRLLPAAERLRLATLILEGLPPEAVADDSGEWSNEDLADFADASWSRAPGL
jgi:hypothetical protein